MNKFVKSALLLPFKAIGFGAKLVVNGRLMKQQSGAKFAAGKDVRRWLSSSNTGLLLDGRSAHLSETESFQNLCLIARVGAGKTSRYIIPNVLDRADKSCSMVVNDPKGEVFEATSGAMARAGYRIVVIEPENPGRSSRFNPLYEARSDVELEQLAEIIVRCGNPNGNPNDTFWISGGTRVVSILLKALANVEATSQSGVLTLSNVAYLLQNFGRLGGGLKDFMRRASIDPNDPNDQHLWNEWMGVLTGNPDGVQSFVLNAVNALRPMSNRTLGWMTAASDFKLSDLRRRKTIVYFITPPQLSQYYGFLTSLFFQSVFNAAMREMPRSNDLPLYVLYDEFGHSTIPTFAAVANTIRAYKVSLSIVLQSISQLPLRYGRDAAQSLQGGFNTIQTYAGSDPSTCSFFASLCGIVRERERKTPLLDPNPRYDYREFALLHADEVRTLKSDETIIVSTNRDPVRMSSTPHFENSTFKSMVARGTVRMPTRPVDIKSVPIVRLK